MRLIEANRSILNQLTVLIQSLHPLEFTEKIEVLNGATIGQHIRHTLEFYTCLMQGVARGMVDYDKRAHSTALENDPEATLALMQKIESFLQGSVSNTPLTLLVNYNREEGVESKVETNLFRELVYNIEHAVHHMALIKIGVKQLRPDIVLADDFGVAVSTLRYKDAIAQD